MPKTYEFRLPGITCAACVAPVENALSKCKSVNVQNIDVSILDKIATVTVADASLPDNQVKNLLRSTIEDVGYECLDADIDDTTEQSLILPRSKSYSNKTKHLRVKKSKPASKNIRYHWIKGAIGLLAGAALLGLSMFGVCIPPVGMCCVAGLSSLLTFYLGKETYYEAGNKLFKSKTLSMDALFSVSTLTAVGVSIASFFVPWLPMMYDAALLIFGFRHIGKAIEESAKEKVLKGLTFRARASLDIDIEDTAGKIKKTEVKTLRSDDVIRVPRGQIIPVDGICLNEKTFVYNTIITGRTLPQEVKKGDFLRAGTKVPDDVEYIKIKVSATEADSYLALLDEKIKQAHQEKAPLETKTKKILQYFVPAVFALATIAAITIGIILSPPAAISCAASLLVSACPCTLGLITPLAIKIGIAKAAENGVRFKSGKSLQAAQQVDRVVLDLNGTLTTGVPRVTLTTIPDNMLDYLAALERGSDHPIAAAICKFIDKKRPQRAALSISQIDRSSHSGIVAEINGEIFTIGNKNMMISRGIDVSRYIPEIEQHQVEHVIYLARGAEVIGYILLHDPLREDAKQVVSDLKRMGKEVYICTGADNETAKKYSLQLGISPENVKADCIAESKNAEDNTKTRFIRELSTQGHKVAMVGDAGNDAPAIEASHFGIAVKSNASDKITQQKAAAVIYNTALRPITTAFTVANQAVSNIKQNLAISLSYNLLTVLVFGGLLVALGFAINPALGAALMILQTAFILYNAQRFKNQKISVSESPPEKEPICEDSPKQDKNDTITPQPKPKVEARLGIFSLFHHTNNLQPTSAQGLTPLHLTSYHPTIPSLNLSKEFKND